MKIYLADDHELVANGLAGLLNESGLNSVVRIFSNGKDLYKAVLSEQPKMIFLDVEMPIWNGIETLRKLKEEFPSIPCLMLSMVEEISIIETCLTIGANGFLHKNSSAEELANAITTALRGEIFLSNETTQILNGLKRTNSSSDFELKEPLSQREIDVLKLLCDGMTSKEIGDQLFISHRTVEVYKNNLLQKFNVKTSGKLIALAIKNKIIS